MTLRLSAVTAAIRSQYLWGALPAMIPGLVLANPTGGQVVGGAAVISTDANTVRIDQTSPNAAINWQSFSVDGQQYIIFNQPSVSSATLNRVIGADPSVILGHLQANGRVFLINPNGVMFGEGAQVDVNGLVATTLDINPQDFLAGKFTFKGGSDKGVVNAGRIQAADGGFVVLAGDHVQNSGEIAARLGKAVLASGSEVTLDIKGNGLVSYAIDAAAVTDAAGVENLGTIAADGGTVVMDARVARSLTATVVNNQGLIQARTISTDKRGNVYLNGDGGDVVNSGVIDVSAPAAGAKAGTVVVHSSKDITLTEGSRISANGDKGGEIRIVAEEVAALEQGSLVDAAGAGGFAELSGHKRLDINGRVNLYHGMLLIDPARVEILGYGSTGTIPYGSGSTSYISERFLEDQLHDNDVVIVATQQISAVGSFDNNDIDGSGDGLGHGLTLGIGTVNSGTGSYGAYGFETTGAFNRGSGGGRYDYGIDLDGIAIRTDGDLKIIGGYAEGMVRTGDLESTAGDITVTAYGDISTGDLSAVGHDITVDAEYGALNFSQKTIFADHINLFGRNGVSISNSTLAGAPGFVDIDGFNLSIAAHTIGIYAGTTANIVIEDSSNSVTAQNITIQGGNVTIRDETLSGGHGSDYCGNNSRVVGAQSIHIEATGTDPGYGNALVEDSGIIGNQITITGNTSVTVLQSALGGEYNRLYNSSANFGSTGEGSPSYFGSSHQETLDGAQFIHLNGGSVGVHGSGLAADDISITGGNITITSDNGVPTGLAQRIHHASFSSSESSFSAESDELHGGGAININGTGDVHIAGVGLAANSIHVRGRNVTVGSSGELTLMGGNIHHFSSSSDGDGFSPDSLTAANSISLTAYAGAPIVIDTGGPSFNSLETYSPPSPGGVLRVDYSVLSANQFVLNATDEIDTSTSHLTIGVQASFAAPEVYVGELEMVGTNLIFKTDELNFGLSNYTDIYRPEGLDPSQIFAQFSPYSRPNLRLEQSIDGIEDPTALLIGVDEHLSYFPGTTFAFGDDGFTGALGIGLNGPVNGDLGNGHPENFIFIGGPGATLNGLTGYPVNGIPLTTNGVVVFLGSFAKTASGEALNILNLASQYSGDAEKRRREQQQNGKTDITTGNGVGTIENEPPAQECT